MTHRKRVPNPVLWVFVLALMLALVAPGAPAALAAGGTVWYVDADATGGSRTGTSWANAFTDLQAGLAAAATSPAEIWVAEGTYKPTVEYGGTGDRYKSFQLKNGVALYGGFDPSVGVGHDEFWERDWVAHPTILSGDLGSSGDNSDNSYHVFYHPSGTNLDSTAILDGFTITGGNANGSDAASRGGGMYNTGSPTLTRCTFTGNSATIGGGMFNTGSTGSPVLTSCIFAGNSAGEGGGGMANYSSAMPKLINCVFTGNSADQTGGGMYNLSSAPALVGCTFSGNSAGELGVAGVVNWSSSSTTLTNCILWGNVRNQLLSIPSLPDGAVRYSDIDTREFYPGDNIKEDPLFVDPDGADNVVGTVDDDLRLGVGSPAINAGNNDLLPADMTDLDRDGNITEKIPFDLDHNPRIVNGTVDMGAYERQALPPAPVVAATAALGGDDVLLAFAYVSADITYEVYVSADPWFGVLTGGTLLATYSGPGTPSDACRLSGGIITCTIRDILGDPNASFFYVIRALYPEDEDGHVPYADSNRTGVIGFALAPGS